MSEVVIVMMVMLVVAVPAVMYFMGFFGKAPPKPSASTPTEPAAVAKPSPPKKEVDPCRGFLPASPNPECLDKIWKEAGCELPVDERWAWWGKAAGAAKDKMTEFAKRTSCLTKEELYGMIDGRANWNTFMTKLQLVPATRSDLDEAQKEGAQWCWGALLEGEPNKCTYPMQTTVVGCPGGPGVHSFACDGNTWPHKAVIGVKPPSGANGISLGGWSGSLYSKYND